MSVVEVIPALHPYKEVEVPQEVVDAVTCGVERLDAAMPGWPLLVNRGLNIWSMRECVLGQVYGHYDEGCRSLGVSEWDTRWGQDNGFIPLLGWAKALEAEWTRVINERRITLRH